MVYAYPTNNVISLDPKKIEKNLNLLLLKQYVNIIIHMRFLLLQIRQLEN